MILIYRAIKKHRAAKAQARARAQNTTQSHPESTGIAVSSQTQPQPSSSLTSNDHDAPQHFPLSNDTTSGQVDSGHNIEIDVQDLNSSSKELQDNQISPPQDNQISPPNPNATTNDSKSRPIKWRKLWNFWRVTVALALPVFLETLDYTIVATAQPAIASYFNSLDLQSYIGTIYLLTSTVFLPLYATLADVFGRYFAMQTALIFFMLGSAISTGARNITMMLAGRGIAGIGAAGILAVVRVILSDSASLDANNRLAVIFIILYTPGYVLGPTIGGALTQTSWRWVFAINLPILVVSMIIVFLLLRNSVKGPQLSHHSEMIYKAEYEYSAENNSEFNPNLSILQKLSSIDFPGAILFITGFIIILLALNWGSTSTSVDSEWKSARVIACFVVGGCLVISCFIWELVLERYQTRVLMSSKLKTKPGGEHFASNPNLQPKKSKFNFFFWKADPMIPLNIFTSYDVCATLLGAFSSGMVMFVLFYFISIFMTIVTGLSSFKAGVQLLYFTPGLAGGSFISSILIKTLRQPKYPCILGTAIITIADGLIARAMDLGNQSQIEGFLALAGVGVGMTFGPLAVHARFSQPNNRVAVVVALNLFARTIGGTIGLAQCATILNAKVNSYLSAYIAQNVNSGISLSDLSTSSLSSLGNISSLPPEIQTAVRNAFRRGVYWCFISLIPWNGLATISLMFLSNIPDTDKLKEDSENVVTQGEEGRMPRQVGIKKKFAQNDSDGLQLNASNEKSINDV